jgi:hypothetical protein
MNFTSECFTYLIIYEMLMNDPLEPHIAIVSGAVDLWRSVRTCPPCP